MLTVFDDNNIPRYRFKVILCTPYLLILRVIQKSHSKMPAWTYAAHPRIEVVCMIYAMGKERLKLRLPEEKFPFSKIVLATHTFLFGTVFLNTASGIRL